MKGKPNLNDVYDKNLNFLIGSGASFGLFPTLGLKIQDENEVRYSIESLGKKLEKDNKSYTALFMYYYTKCIAPIIRFDPNDIQGVEEMEVFENYKKLIRNLLSLIGRKKNLEKRCNVFTTNYDGCLAFAADDLLENDHLEFRINDGGQGFRTRYVQARNFDSFQCNSGVFDRHLTDIPQLNLVNIHGSIYWKSVGEHIIIDYSNPNKEIQLRNFSFENPGHLLQEFFETLEINGADFDDLNNVELTRSQRENFWKQYETLPIVNPTKWKFHETVFEEHYYQMLRLMSYELEKPNSLLITFGFSFADEHIFAASMMRRNLKWRSYLKGSPM